MLKTSLDVSVIIVNYKTSSLVKNVLLSIFNNSFGFSYEIIIVDNSCDSNELSMLNSLRNRNQHLLIIDAKENLGFGKANNLASSCANGKYLFFLNSDTILLNNAIYELMSFLENRNDVGVVGSNLFTSDMKPNHSFFPFRKTIKGEKRYRLFSNFFIRFPFNRRIDFNYTNKPKQIDGYVCGAAFMIPKDLFFRVGGFDNDIFMYAEEALLCHRIVCLIHKKIYNIPSSKIIHFEGASFENMSSSRIKRQIDGNYLFYLKAYGEKQAKRYLNNQLNYVKTRLFFAKLFSKGKVDAFTTMKHVVELKIMQLTTSKNR